MYDPYGNTTILDANGPIPYGLPADPASTTFYHDADFDDDIDAADAASLTACLNANTSPCVWLHDRNGDNRVDLLDQALFVGFYDPQLSPQPAPAEFGMPPRDKFDANGDSRIDLWDFYAFAQAQGATDPLHLAIFDTNADNTVTLADYTTWFNTQSGPGLPAWLTPTNTSRYGNPYMWTGQRRDATTKQYHFWARAYSPHLGRWLQRDPLGYVDGVNLYEYGVSSPKALTDSLGLKIQYVTRKGITYLHVYGGTGLLTQGYLSAMYGNPSVTGEYIGTLAYKTGDFDAAAAAEVLAHYMMTGATLKALGDSLAEAISTGVQLVRVGSSLLDDLMSAAEFIDDPSVWTALAMLPGIPHHLVAKFAKNARRVKTVIKQTKSRAPKIGVPNSIVEHIDDAGRVRSRTFYDENGRSFARQDFDHPHGGISPHEHARCFDAQGRPITGNRVNPLPPGYDNSPTP